MRRPKPRGAQYASKAASLAIRRLHAGSESSGEVTPTLALGVDGAVNSTDLTQPSALMVRVSLYASPHTTNWMLAWCQVTATRFGFASGTPPNLLPPSTSASWSRVPGPSRDHIDRLSADYPDHAGNVYSGANHTG
jgi:hypothetical protein